MASGTEENQGPDPSQEEALIKVLDRQQVIGALDALVDALGSAANAIPITQTAIGLDASVFLRLSSHRRSADIIDYLSSSHSAPLILPGQAIQEFWNNQLQAVETVATNLKRKFNELREDVLKIDAGFGDYAAQFTDLLEKFNDEYGHIYDEATTRRTRGLLEILQQRALLPHAARVKFQEIATHRKRTKTPPGFRDDGDGDFFIWVDFLTGLQLARAEQQQFAQAVLVSNDRKVDWSRSGITHPILAAEVRALVGVPFGIWSIDKLAEEIGNVKNAGTSHATVRCAWESCMPVGHTKIVNRNTHRCWGSNCRADAAEVDIVT